MAISEQRDHQVRIESGELRAVFGDNDSDPPGAPWSYKGDPPLPASLRHHPGYNGVRERPRSRERPNSVAPSGSPVLPTRAAWKEGWLNRDPAFPLALPYFFGRPSVTPGDEGMVFMTMLDTGGVPGFAQPAPLDEPFGNATWDFHVTFPRVHAGERHGFRARLVLCALWSERSKRRFHVPNALTT